jgi:hypothetical protein
MLFYRFSFEVPESPDVVMVRLRCIVEEESEGHNSFKSVPQVEKRECSFLGTVEKNTFQIHRDINYINSWLPQIKGNLAPIPSGTRVDVRMRLQRSISLFTVFFATFSAVITVLNFLYGNPDAGVFAYVPMLLFVASVGLPVGCFYPEAYKARRLLAASLVSAMKP